MNVLNKEVKDMCCIEKILCMTMEIQDEGLKKSGFNSHIKYKYFELEDIVPFVNTLSIKYRVFIHTTFTKETIVVTVINLDNADDKQVYESPIALSDSKGNIDSKSIGAAHTYFRRYMYLIIFNICEADNYNASLRNEEEEDNEVTPAQAGATILTFGKHKGKTLKEVFIEDNQYFRWLQTSDNTDRKIKGFIQVMDNALKESTKRTEPVNFNIDDDDELPFL